MEVVRKIFYEKLTGNIILDTGDRQGSVIETTVEQDIVSYTSLSERNRDTFDVLELPYGAYQQDFAIATGYRVNPETKELEFSYPDPNEPEVEQPYITPLSEKVAALKDENEMLNMSVMELSYYAATQDESIKNQGSAIMELSMFIMGGM